MAEPPLRITGFLCVLVTCLLVGLIAKNAMQEDPLTLPQVSEGTTPKPEKTQKPTTTPEVPNVPYSADTDGDGGEVVKEPADGSRRDGHKTLPIAREGFSLTLPPSCRPKVFKEGPSVYFTVNLDNQPSFLVVSSRSIFPWTDDATLIEHYEPYQQAERITNDAGVDLASGGNRWSMPDDKSLVILRGQRLYKISSAGFGKEFPEQVALLNTFKFLDLPTHSQRVAKQLKVTEEQLKGPPPEKFAQEVKELTESLAEKLRGGVPRPAQAALEYYKSKDEHTYLDMALMREFFQELADHVAKSMRQH